MMTEKAKILVCTPTRGGTHPEYAASLAALVRLYEVDISGDAELVNTWLWQEDVVRVRSRFVRAFLETKATHLHFRDADVSARAAVVTGLLRAGKEIVAAPYPRRDGINWTGAAQATALGLDPECLAFEYGVGLKPGTKLELDPQDCTPVEWMPLGCSLITRGALERMTDYFGKLDQERADLDYAEKLASKAYAPGGLELQPQLSGTIHQLVGELRRWRAGHMGLTYEDRDNLGNEAPTVGIFQLMNRASGHTGKNRLWGEDQSFCMRATDIGIPVHMFLGEGSPVDHAGEHVRRGHVEAFGLTRSAATAEQLAGPTTERAPAGAP